MDAVNYSNFRKNLKHYFKQVNDDSEPLIVTNKVSSAGCICVNCFNWTYYLAFDCKKETKYLV